MVGPMGPKPMPPILLLMAIVAMVVLHREWPMARWAAYPWTLFGLAPMCVGIGVAMWAARLFRNRGTTIRPGFESSALVTTGPFRVSRNPMYLGMALLLIGIGVLMGTATPLLVVPVFVVLIQVMFVRMEERMLGAAFGDEYAAYRRRVRAWV